MDFAKKTSVRLVLRTGLCQSFYGNGTFTIFAMKARKAAFLARRRHRGRREARRFEANPFTRLYVRRLLECVSSRGFETALGWTGMAICRDINIAL